MQSLSLQITRVGLHHKLQLLIRICFLLDYLLLFLKAFVAVLNMCLFPGKDIEQIPCLAKKYLLKVSGRNPKRRCEIC